jgi:hypothetical protein
MKTTFKNAVLGSMMAATAAAGVLATATPAQAHEWGGRDHHGGGGIAIAAGLIGLAAGVAIASDHDHYVERAPVQYYAPPVAYYSPPVAYAPQVSCYDAYPGYDGYCYPASYYVNLGWGWRDGGWWYGGARYARPFVVGGYRGGYRGGYVGGGYHGGYQGEGYHGGYRGGYVGQDHRGGYAAGGYGAPQYRGGYAGGGREYHGGGEGRGDEGHGRR